MGKRYPAGNIRGSTYHPHRTALLVLEREANTQATPNPLDWPLAFLRAPLAALGEPPLSPQPGGSPFSSDVRRRMQRKSPRPE